MSAHKFIDLSKARVLISNDDGINAQGLKVLEKAVRAIAKEAWVVAPETEQSAVAHSITLRNPLRIRHVSGKRFAVDGTPTDCVLLAINEIMKDNPPDIVLSGINNGCNLGEDVTYSGTVAAAIEGLLLGVPSIAFSQHFEDGKPIHWPTAAHWTPIVLKKLQGMSIPKNTFLNVNFPDVVYKDVTGMKITSQGERKIGDSVHTYTDPKGKPYYWIGSQQLTGKTQKGSDIAAVESGAVSITPLSIDLTNKSVLRTMRKAFQ
jgi:5'-nucleotidase